MHEGANAVLTGEMVRAGRAIARIEQTELANAAGLSLDTIKRLERLRGVVNANPTTLAMLRRAFHAHGVHFRIDEDGRSCVFLETTGGDRRVDRIEEPGPEPMRICRAVYYSWATPETVRDAPGVLDDILQAAVALNGRLGVTGALLMANGFFVQALEGPPPAVWEVLGGIAMDRRHQSFTPVDRIEVAERRFARWIMCGIGAARAADLAAFDPRGLDGAGAVELLSRLSAAEDSALGEPHATS